MLGSVQDEWGQFTVTVCRSNAGVAHSLASFFAFARCLRLTLPSTMRPTVDHRAATPADLPLLKRLQ